MHLVEITVITMKLIKTKCPEVWCVQLVTMKSPLTWLVMAGQA